LPVINLLARREKKAYNDAAAKLPHRMPDEPERRPESEADSAAAEDDGERDDRDSGGSGSEDATEDGNLSKAESSARRKENQEESDDADDDASADGADADADGAPEDAPDADGDAPDDPPDDGDAPGDASGPDDRPAPDDAPEDRRGPADNRPAPEDAEPEGRSASEDADAPEVRPVPEDAEPEDRPAPDDRVHGPEPPDNELPDDVEGPRRPRPDDEGEPDGGAVSVDRPDNMAETTPVERKTGPASDEEMPLADHIEEMVTRLFVVIAIGGVLSVAVFPFGEEIIDFLWYSVLPGGDVAQPRVYHPLSLILTQLKVASLAGLIVALPVFVYQTYEFMRPGLYPHERRYYLASVPMSLVLALVGVTFAYFVVLPSIFTYFLYYSEGVTTIAFALSDTFNLILLLMGYLALVFQIPLFIMLAIMMGLTTRRWLQDRRLYFWGGFLGVAFLFSPDPTGMAPILVAATMVTLFEGTLLLLRWTGR
jgi:sec-independent protein translocase protein TatC